MDITDPSQAPDAAKRYQIMLREDPTGLMQVDLADNVAHTGVTMPLTDALQVVDVISDVVLRYVQHHVGDRLPFKLETLPIVEEFLRDQAHGHEVAAIRTSRPRVENPDVEEWRGDRADLQWRVVEWHDRICHAITDRRYLALQMVSEMAIFEAGAQRISQGDPDHLVDCYETGVFDGLVIAAIMMFGSEEGGRMMDRALKMSKDLEGRGRASLPE